MDEAQAFEIEMEEPDADKSEKDSKLHRNPFTFNADSSNLASFVKLNSREDDIFGPRKYRQLLSIEDEQKGDEEKVKIPKKNQMPTRKLTLMSEENDLTMVALGQAIRSGSVQTVKNIIESNSIAILNRLGITFETFLRRLSQKSGLVTVVRPDKMYLTPFHLAIISQQDNVVSTMLDFVINSEYPAESLKKLLSVKTSLKFANGDPDSYFKDDRTLDGINAFHLAGRFHCQSLVAIVKVLRDQDLIDSVLDLIQVKDPHMGKTPLHMATKNSSSLALTIFLLCGVNVDSTDNRGYTALHMASKEGFEANCQVLLENRADPNALGDKNHAKTPLHRARSQKVVNVLLKYGANPCIKGSEKNSIFGKLLLRNPLLVNELFLSGIQTNRQDLDSSGLQIIYDFELFFNEMENGDEMTTHSKLVNSKSLDLLQNPLVDAYLQIKWQLIQKFFYLNLACFSFFLVMFTFFGILTGKLYQCSLNHDMTCWSCDCSRLYNYNDPKANFYEIINSFMSSEDRSCQTLGNLQVSFFCLTLIGLIYLIGRESSECLSNYRTYFAKRENILETLLVTFTLAFIVLCFFDVHLPIHFGAWALFFSWWDLALMLGRIPSIGIYIQLSTSVMKTLAIFVLLYLPFLIAFALIFYLLLPGNESFTDIWLAFIKVFGMMAGEFELKDNFLNDGVEFAGSTQIAFLLFLLVGNIVIANLLIGLTVSKTEELFKVAQSVKLEKLVRHVHEVSRRFRFFAHKSSLKPILTKGNWKVCVLPNNSDQLLKAQDDFNYSFAKDFPVYLYDDQIASVGEKLNFTLPASVVASTIGILKLRNEDKLAQESQKTIKQFDALEVKNNCNCSQEMDKVWQKLREMSEIQYKILEKLSIETHF